MKQTKKISTGKKSAARAACPVCGEVSRTLLPYGGYAYRGGCLPLVRCAQCGLKYVDYDMPDVERKALYNEEEYFESAYAGGGGHGGYFENETEQQQKAEDALRIIRRFAPTGRLFEIGCAGGYFLECARKIGYEVSGVEVSRDMSVQARARGLDVYTGELSEVPNIGLSDVVYLGDVLEHVPEPLPFLEQIKARVRPGGFITIEVPLTYNLTLSAMPAGVLHWLRGHFGYRYFLPAQHRGSCIVDKPYHLLFFNRPSLKELAKRAELEVSYLSVYEGKPKSKFAGTFYYWIKYIGSFFSRYTPQRWWGDRGFVVMQKSVE